MPCTCFLDCSTLIIVVVYNSVITLFCFFSVLSQHRFAVWCTSSVTSCAESEMKSFVFHLVTSESHLISALKVIFLSASVFWSINSVFSKPLKVACASLPCGMCSASQHTLHCDLIVVPLKVFLCLKLYLVPEIQEGRTFSK